MARFSAPEISPALLRCLRWDDEGLDRLRDLSLAEWELLWETVNAGAGQHLLARRLQIAGLKAPEPIAAKLHAHALTVAARNLAGRSALASAIRETGRPALLLKGVDLAERLYRNLGLRPMGDVDFLVRVADAPAYHAYFRSQGYDATPEPGDAVFSSRGHHQILYRVKGEKSAVLELHWRFGVDDEDRGVDLDGIWERAVAHPALAPAAYVMAPDDLFLYLCLHLKHHAFDTPLTQIWDLAELLRASWLPIDWPNIWTRADEWRLTESVNIALYLVRVSLGVSTAQISEWMPSPSLAQKLPDVLAPLGRYPFMDRAAGHHLTPLLSAHSSLKERYDALKEGALPPRAQIRALHGRSGDRFWNDCISYMRHWRHLLRIKSPKLNTWFAYDPSEKSRIERVAALRRHLNQN